MKRYGFICAAALLALSCSDLLEKMPANEFAAETFFDSENDLKLYANGLTKGYSEKTFGGTDPVTAAQYLTFVLRALGYSSDSDFRWDAAWELTNELGITAGVYRDLAKGENF